MSKSTDSFHIAAGEAYPLGATVTEEGVNFALFSANAEQVELCLYDTAGKKEIMRIQLREKTDDIWHCAIEGLQAGYCYGYRVYGPFDPSNGHRFNPHKLLIDPYAKQLSSAFTWHESHYAYPADDTELDLAFDTVDSADFMPKAVILEPVGAAAKNTDIVPWNETVIYETHVKGFTKLHKRIPGKERGTYCGLAHPDVIAYLLDLGITTVELLPVQTFVDEHFLVKKGLNNYWGYNTLNFFCPHGPYASTKPDEEFIATVNALHEAGLEVILDVVYNHTAEGNHLGPTLSFRGIDNASYYSLEQSDARFYVNDTGCGNTLNIKHPRVRQLVLDSLRYWAGDLGVDGFRFDLATVMGREADGFNPNGYFFEIVKQDPILATKKLIAEPWDIGPGGYQMGNFPIGWSEWNDKYRDTVRRYWRGDSGVLPEFARRIHGSSDIFEGGGRRPSASVNFIAAHDGFTTRDIVSYNKKHNEDNKEQNQDGHNANFSYNHGIEGPTDNREINQLRLRQQRNLLATLLISQGTPMLNMGDELGRSQQGNNNAYCQDNEINWLNWSSLVYENWQLKSFVRYVLWLRREYPLLQSSTHIHKPHEDGSEQTYNIHWLNVHGEEMSEEEWNNGNEHALCWMLESTAVSDKHCTVTTLFNPLNCNTLFQLPEGWQWRPILDTRNEDGRPSGNYVTGTQAILLMQKSLMMFVGIREIDKADTTS